MDEHTLYAIRVSELREMQAMIHEELRLFNDYGKDALETQFIKRLKVRTMFSCVEANIFHLKGSALLFSDNPEKEFTRKDWLALQDIEEITGQDGIVRQRSARITMKDNIQLAVGSLAKSLGKTYKANFGSKGGQAFLKAVEIRDRIVHPHAVLDWKLSKHELEIIDLAWDWFGAQMVACLG